jgi:hypothetical protein
MIKKLASYIDDHLDYIRYLWPDKNVSARFKFLNWVSADWLRIRINDVRSAVYRVHMYSDMYKRSIEPDGVPLNEEELRRILDNVCRHLERVDMCAEELFRI